MTNGHCHETYEIEEPRKDTGKDRTHKTKQVGRRVGHAIPEETSPARERELRRR